MNFDKKYIPLSVSSFYKCAWFIHAYWVLDSVVPEAILI